MREIVETRNLGPWQVTPVGLGCMQLSRVRTSPPDVLNDRPYAVAVIHSALDAGITLLDTADIYAPSWNTFGHNEKLVGDALRSWSGTPEQKTKVVVATKIGITRGPGESWGRASTKDYFLRAAEASALRLGVEKIQLLQHHRMNPEMTFEEQFENVLVLKERGIVEQIGLSNVNLEQLERAIKIGGSAKDGGVISVQNEFSPRYRLWSEVIDYCAQNEISYLPWSPYGGLGRSGGIASGDFGVFNQLGQRKKVSPYAIAISWLLHRSSTIIPIPGASRPEQIVDSLVGATIELTNEEFAEIQASLPANPQLDDELIDQPLFRD
jgi:aryl-alcohol dehydrogenase-like predicted oxidoreductase